MNGSKVFITGGGRADTYVVFAMTDKSKGNKGISAFIVDKDDAGFSIGKIEHKMGIRGSQTSELIFEDVHLPADRLLGKENGGFKIAMMTLDGGRIGIAAQALGIAQGALDLSKVSREALKRFAQTINLDMMLQNHKEDIVAWEFERLSDTSKKYILENISKDILENWNLLFEKKKKKHENLREIWFSGYFSLILNSLQYDLKNKEEWKLSFLNYEKILEKDMYAWYEKTTHMCCAFFYDITQIFYIVLAGQEKQIIEADESVTQSIRKIQLFIRRHEDYWKV